MLPAWLTLSAYLQRQQRLRDSSTPNHGDRLRQPRRRRCAAIQLAGIWLDGDFRNFPGAAAVAPQPPPDLVSSSPARCSRSAGRLWKRQLGLALYVGVALVALAILSLRRHRARG